MGGRYAPRPLRRPFSSGASVGVYAIGQLRKVAAELGDVQITQRADAALEHDHGTLEKERLWQVARSQKSGARGRAAELDNHLDRIVSGMHTSVSALKGAL